MRVIAQHARAGTLVRIAWLDDANRIIHTETRMTASPNDQMIIRAPGVVAWVPSSYVVRVFINGESMCERPFEVVSSRPV